MQRARSNQSAHEMTGPGARASIRCASVILCILAGLSSCKDPGNSPELSAPPPEQRTDELFRVGSIVIHETDLAHHLGEHYRGRIDEKTRQIAQSAEERAQLLKESAAQKAQDFREYAGERASQIADSAGEKAAQFKDAAGEHWEETRVKAREVHADLEEYIRQHPTKSVMVAAGVGFLLGLIVRR